jgi:hypothetical protein
MVSFEVRRAVRAIELAALVTAVCASHERAAQFASGSGDEDPLAPISQKIAQVQHQGGTYSKELIEPLTHLSLLYRENGDYALEAAVLEQALQVVRANYGLRSLEQAPLMRQRIRAEESRGNFAEGWALEQELLALAHKHPQDLRTVPILHEVGDKRMDLRRRFLAGERPPQLVLGCYYEGPKGPIDGSRNCESGSRSGAAQQMLMEAQRHYFSAILPLRLQQQTASPELDELEDKLYRNSYLLNDYQAGRQSLVRRIDDDVANEEPPQKRIDRLVELADWDLRARRYTLAFDLYAQIYAYLDEHGARARIDELFSPATPIALPTFVPNPFAAERAEGAIGYVDVEFDVTPFGTRRIRVVAAHNASRAVQQRVQRWVVMNRFRPRMAEGTLAETSRVTARHYVHE